MLKIINDLKPFFEDCYRRINVREYAKIMRISPPTASKLLARYASEGLLRRETYRNYLLFHANNESRDFIDLSRMNWRRELAALTSFLENKLMSPTVILFGSLAKAEAKKDSDVDLAVFSGGMKLDVSGFEARLRRKIHAFWFDSPGRFRAESGELKNNVINGYLLTGRMSI